MKLIIDNKEEEIVDCRRITIVVADDDGETRYNIKLEKGLLVVNKIDDTNNDILVKPSCSNEVKLY